MIVVLLYLVKQVYPVFVSVCEIWCQRRKIPVHILQSYWWDSRMHAYWCCFS